MIAKTQDHLDVAKAVATPGIFAMEVSRGTRMPFSMYRHHGFLDRKLCDVAAGRLKRLVIEEPPRHGKSLHTSKYFPAWYLGHLPHHNIIHATAGDDLSKECGAFARDVLIEHGQKYFGIKIPRDRSSVQDWKTSEGGGMRSATVMGSIMGRGADLVIIDDYFKDVHAAISERLREKLYQWFLSTATTRLTPNGAIILIATRWHTDDLIGKVLKEAEVTGEHWEVVRLPAIADDDDQLGRKPGEALWPERFDEDWMERRRKSYHASGYPWQWEALYQQNPPDVLDCEWDPSYFENCMFDDWPAPNRIKWRVLALDPSLGKTDKSDYQAFTMLVVDKDNRIWVDANLEREDITKMVDRSVRLYNAFSADTFVLEANGFQEALAIPLQSRAIKASTPMNLSLVKNRVDKVMRIKATVTPWLATGRIKFRNGSGGSALLLEQLKAFPSHRYDDGPDSLEMAIRMVVSILRHGRPEPETGGPDQIVHG